MSEEDGGNFLIMDNLRIEKELWERKWNRRWSSVLVQLFVFLFGFISLTFLITSKFSPFNKAFTSNQKLTDMTTSSEINFSLDTQSFVVLESRSVGYEEVKSKNLLPWDLIVEPNRANTVRIAKFVFNRVDMNVHTEDFKVIWSFGGEEYYGPSFQLELSSVGAMKGGIKIFRKAANDAASSSDMELLYSQDITVAVKYVRREIRSLTEADRSKFLKALRIMYTTSQEDGNQRYGSSFLSAETILLTHLTSAGMTDCDHWHDGAGFLTHHIALTLLVEQSLQAVEPSLAMPYWDYALDGGQYTAETISQSEVFQPDWFGEASPSNSDHRINDGGFWSGISFPSGAKYSSDWDIAATGSLNPHVNGYGLMRSPWNNNPSPFLGRRNSTYGVRRTVLPSCKDFQRCFLKSTLKEMKFEFNGLTHGPVHILVGGAWAENAELFHQTITDRRGVTRPVDDNLDYLLQGPIKVVMFKLLWRMGYTRCPQTCPDLPASCRCSVPQRFLDDYGARKILLDTNISEYLSLLPQFKAHADDDEYLYKVLRALEDPGVVGDMLTSAAAYDPIFWPIHGTVERLLSYKRTVVRLGLGPAQLAAFNEDWGFPEFKISNNNPYLNGVCDWSKVKGPADLTLPTCNLGASCEGHGEKDFIRVFELAKKKDMVFTNKGFYEYIRPWNDDLPYVYHSYDFDYCSEQGYPFLE